MPADRKITKIYVHCSYSLWGSVDDIRHWHTDPVPTGRGWSDIGYHFVVHNPFTTYKLFSDHSKAVAENEQKQLLYSTHTDGQIVPGRPLSIPGAHVEGDNDDSIGICYVGVSPTAAQYNALLVLCAQFVREYKIPIDQIFGHYEASTSHGKTCPNFDIETFRKMLRLIVE